MALARHPSFTRKRELIVRSIAAFAGITALAFALTACGVQRDLVRPSDIEQEEQGR